MLDFRAKLVADGVLFWEYETPIDFERRFREHLTNQVLALTRPQATPKAVDELLPTIYLSYKREDLNRVEPVYEALKVAGYEPWLDVRDILPGMKWLDEIQSAIQSTDFFLVFLSTKALVSPARPGLA